MSFRIAVIKIPSAGNDDSKAEKTISGPGRIRLHSKRVWFFPGKIYSGGKNGRQKQSEDCRCPSEKLFHTFDTFYNECAFYHVVSFYFVDNFSANNILRSVGKTRIFHTVVLYSENILDSMGFFSRKLKILKTNDDAPVLVKFISKLR